MSDSAQNFSSDKPPTGAEDSLPSIKFQASNHRPDFATILGLSSALGLIIVAIFMGKSDANFFNVPALLIVILGTIAATSTSYTGEELSKAWRIIGESMFGNSINPSKLAHNLIDTAVVAKKKGILALSAYEKETSKDRFLKKSIQMVVDGYNPDDVDFFLSQEIESEIDRHKRSAGITRRASEVAPAMGLIGTLVGLVQMLADLENPETIGPAMAVALLTTFYGAIFGTIIMAPLTVKLEKRSSDHALIRTLIKTACVSIARQENPRKLEMLLNADLPPSKRIRYFD